MIRYFKWNKERGLETLSAFEKGCWVSVISPSKEELDQLVALGVTDDALFDVLDENEVPRIQVEDKVVYIFTRIPHEKKRANLTVSTMPVLIGITKNFIFSVAADDQIFDPLVIGGYLTSNSDYVGFLVGMFSLITARYSGYIQHIARQIRVAISDTEQISNRDIVRFVHLEQNLNDFSAALIPTQGIFEKILIDTTILPASKDRYELLEDAELEITQLINVTRSNAKMVANIRDAYSTILTNNLNRVIKALTIVTTILTVPTIVTSFYGMNIFLPLAHQENAFLYIILISAVLILFVLGIFRWQKWL